MPPEAVYPTQTQNQITRLRRNLASPFDDALFEGFDLITVKFGVVQFRIFIISFNSPSITGRSGETQHFILFYF